MLFKEVITNLAYRKQIVNTGAANREGDLKEALEQVAHWLLTQGGDFYIKDSACFEFLPLSFRDTFRFYGVGFD